VLSTTSPPLSTCRINSTPNHRKQKQRKPNQTKPNKLNSLQLKPNESKSTPLKINHTMRIELGFRTVNRRIGKLAYSFCLSVPASLSPQPQPFDEGGGCGVSAGQPVVRWRLDGC
jgi:hypothetical protein